MAAAARPPSLPRRTLGAMTVTLALSILLAWGAPLSAQSVTTLQAQAWQLAAGQQPTLHLERESQGRRRTVPWPGPEVDWLLLRAGGAQHNLQQPPADTPAGPACRVAAVAPGTQLIGVDLAPRIETVPTAALAGFLATRVGEGTLPADWRHALPEPTVAVRRIESAKLIVRVGADDPPGSGSATTMGKTGQQVEIRLAADPTLVPLAHDLPVKVYLPALTAGATLVLASHPASGLRHSFLTDGGGRGAFTLGRSGAWIFEVHHARPLDDDPAADWEIASATLAFAVPAPAGAGEDDR